MSSEALERSASKQRWRRWASGLLLSAGLLLVHGCGSSEEVIVKTADGVELTGKDIDANPLALMPGGALVLANLQPGELFQSPLGARFLKLAQSQFPLPAGANFDPQRDLQRLLVGLYSVQGVDIAGVAVGHFDPKAIADAASRSEVTPLGTPLVAVKYSKWEFYVSANLGFCVLTPHTALFGNEVGIRRALDRLERGELTVQNEPDVVSLMERPGAPIAVGASNTDSRLDVIAERVPVAQNFRLARIIANLNPPGVNIAGTFTFSDEPSAQAAKQQLTEGYQALQSLGSVGTLFGMSQPIRSYEATLAQSSVQVTLGADTSAAETLLNLLDAILPSRSPSGQ